MIHCNKIYLFTDNGKEILSMNEVMYYLIVNSKPLMEEAKLEDLLAMSQSKWQNFADEVKGIAYRADWGRNEKFIQNFNQKLAGQRPLG
jgi:hypothetical protein